MSIAVLALAGSAPILAVLLTMVLLRWPAMRAMALGWLVASALGLLVWRMTPRWWAAAAL